MYRLLERILLFALTFIFLSWGIYHMVTYARSSMEMETIFEDTLPRSLSGVGIAIREEEPMGKATDGSVRYLYKDATRIGLDQPIMEYYSEEVNDIDLENIRSIEEEIKLLEETQNKNVNNYASALTINRDIREQFSIISQIASTGNCENIPEVHTEVHKLLNRRQIAIGKNENFDNYIAELNNELELLKHGKYMDGIKQIYSPKSGYFAKYTDGLEKSLTPQKIDTWNIADYLELMEGTEESINKQKQGRIITNSDWYLAVSVPAYQMEDLFVGQYTTIEIEGLAQEIPAYVHKTLIENHNDTAIIILVSDIIDEEILNLRLENVTLNFAKYTGLRINSSCLRFRKKEDEMEEMGIFVIENHVVKFKKIDPIYTEPNFVLSKLNYSDSGNSDYVALFDQAITQRNSDIYEGKIIQ